MSYLNPYTTPEHWKKLIEPRENRNGRSYVKKMLPGKPHPLSIPLWIILRRLMGPHATSVAVKRMARTVKLNGVPVKDDRTGVMVGESLDLDDKRYQVLIRRENGRTSYTLEPNEVIQQTISYTDFHKSRLRVNLLNGSRKILMDDTNLVPGSIWTEERIRSPVEATRVLVLTGKNKFKEYRIISAVIEEKTTKIMAKGAHGEIELALTWEDMRQRRYALLL